GSHGGGLPPGRRRDGRQGPPRPDATVPGARGEGRPGGRPPAGRGRRPVARHDRGQGGIPGEGGRPPPGPAVEDRLSAEGSPVPHRVRDGGTRAAGGSGGGDHGDDRRGTGKRYGRDPTSGGGGAEPVGRHRRPSG